MMQSLSLPILNFPARWYVTQQKRTRSHVAYARIVTAAAARSRTCKTLASELAALTVSLLPAACSP